MGEEDHETAVSEGELALLLWHKGDLAGAEALFGRCLTTYRKTRGADHPDVSAVLNNLALIALDRHDSAAAESLLRQSLAIKRKTLGEKHPDLAATLSNLSGALRQQGKYDEAASASKGALQIALPALGDDHPLIASYKIGLARVYLARKDAAAAEPLLRQALQIRRRVFPEDDWRVGATESLLGEALTALARYDEAETLLVDAYRVLKDVPGAQGREARATLPRLVALYEAWGRPEKAASYRPSAPKR
jgi:tetratricopeptide (TPR) repeat protein